MKPNLVKDPTGYYYEIIVWKGLYDGKNYKYVVQRDCYSSITIFFYEFDPKAAPQRDCVGSSGNYSASSNFETWEFWDIKIARKVAEAIIELSKNKYALKEPN